MRENLTHGWTGRGWRRARIRVPRQPFTLQRRNVLDHLPQRLRQTVGRQLDRAWRDEDASEAQRSLEALARNLEADHPGAAASIREGLEETLTVNRLGLPDSLRRTCRSTNAIESMISIGRGVTRNVKRWRDGTMVERWVAAGMTVAQRQFRRVNGYRDLHVLIARAEAARARHVSARSYASGECVDEEAVTEVPRRSGHPPLRHPDG